MICQGNYIRGSFHQNIPEPKPSFSSFYMHYAIYIIAEALACVCIGKAIQFVCEQEQKSACN